MRCRILLAILGIGLCSFCSCQTVKPYQMIYLNDAEMQLEPLKSSAFEIQAAAYREGASGALGKSAGGGCGCN